MNSAPARTAIARIAPLVERSEWVARDVVAQRPFASTEALAAALVECILAAGPARRLALFRVHPELAGCEAVAGRMTDESASEQARLGLMSLSAQDAERLTRLNVAYMARFSHPFILALHRVPDLAALFAIFDQRLQASPLEEHMTTLAEIASVIGDRTAAAFGAGEGDPRPAQTACPQDTSL
ncbi:2-oxo-4-hydroxy-4-carboxy-5-ureidoimidazoline decarboxylase [Pseudooceanicola algae]|uniref:2-oxo-4-hydroxy-4-carboxy-5-ureidoimidazoline decarboxylase n=1 Tax=Pseudooceanicola algae TaxID=1537215 RepID=UPI0018AD0F00|nr:2-oxo-4-hydroxy-4-carboxy-5-ureidoimidazoline decarboxylase [Pseudooceanicola algae]